MSDGVDGQHPQQPLGEAVPVGKFAAQIAAASETGDGGNVSVVNAEASVPPKLMTATPKMAGVTSGTSNKPEGEGAAQLQI